MEKPDASRVHLKDFAIRRHADAVGVMAGPAGIPYLGWGMLKSDLAVRDRCVSLAEGAAARHPVLPTPAEKPRQGGPPTTILLPAKLC
jgi:hypothetical protein